MSFWKGIIIALLIVGNACVQSAPMDGVPALACAGAACYVQRGGGPVCACNARGEARTFRNRCQMEITSCKDGTYYAIVGDGEC